MRTATIAATALAALVSAPLAAQSSVDVIMKRMKQQQTSQAAAALKTDGAAIAVEPIAVDLKKTMGNAKAVTIHPRKVIVAGYNLGGFTTGKTTGKASGGLMGSGATSTLELSASGIHSGLLAKVANAAYSDLVAQLGAAGYEVVALEAWHASANAAKLKLGGEAHDFGDRVGKKGVVAGVTATGVRMSYPLGKVEFGYFGAPKLSEEFGAMIVNSNLAFDFAELSGNRSWGRAARTNAELVFSIDDATSGVMINASKDGRFLDGNMLLQVKDGGVSGDTQFARFGMSSSSDNSAEVGMSNALGVGMRARSKKQSDVLIDPARYEALALAAAKGWNTAIVAQIKAAQGE